MSDTAYIAAAWGGTFLAVGVYAWSVIRRGKKLSKIVPEDERRWL
jgi:hypothetical protein